MNKENSAGLEFDSEELEESSDSMLSNAQSRARNRTVMLTPEMTGEVRSLLKSDDSSDIDDDFLRPGQHAKAKESREEDIVIPPLVAPDRITGGLGLNFGRSTNRAETTRFSREELDLAIDSRSKSDVPESRSTDMPIADAITAPAIPVVSENQKDSSAFNPLTTLAPSNGSAFLKSNKPKPRARPVERQIVKPKATEVKDRPTMNLGSAVSSKSIEQASFATQVVARPKEEVVLKKAKPTSKIVGFLVSYDESEFGEVFQIRAGRKLITSRPTDHGEYLLIDDETVSPLHAILRATNDGKVQVLDQLSEHGTAVIMKGETEEIEITGGLEEVSDGDTIRFGKRTFEVCLITKSSK